MRLAIVSSHINKALQFNWFQTKLKKESIYNIHIIENTLNHRPLISETFKNAYVVNYCNSKEVEQGIIYLYKNYDKAVSFGNQAHLDALEQYTTQVKFEAHLKVYNSIYKV